MTKKVNSNGWQIWSAQEIRGRLLISVGFDDAMGWPVPFDVLEVGMNPDQQWEDLWSGLIAMCDNENERRAIS